VNESQKKYQGRDIPSTRPKRQGHGAKNGGEFLIEGGKRTKLKQTGRGDKTSENTKNVKRAKKKKKTKQNGKKPKTGWGKR